MTTPTVRINEIFYSIQGEAIFSGYPTIFIRTTGCPLRCNYCDTSYAFSGGELKSVEQILEHIAQFNCKRICVTGGEPLVAANMTELLQQLVANNYSNSIETSGAFDIAPFLQYGVIILDIKVPSSTEVERNYWDNLKIIRSTDAIKFVVQDSDDFKWAQSVIMQHQLERRCQNIYFSPSHGVLQPELLADWLKLSGLEARLQLQMHKYIWGDKAGF